MHFSKVNAYFKIYRNSFSVTVRYSKRCYYNCAYNKQVFQSARAVTWVIESLQSLFVIEVLIYFDFYNEMVGKNDLNILYK